MMRGEGRGKKGEERVSRYILLVVLYLEYALDRFPALPFLATIGGHKGVYGRVSPTIPAMASLVAPCGALIGSMV